MSVIRENMEWPPSQGLLDWKMAEHSAWYSGDAEVLANFYAIYLHQNVLNLPYMSHNEQFWGRQIKNQGEVYVHVPIASDIAETSANFLFSEPPIIKIPEAQQEKASSTFTDTQDELDTMLQNSYFNRKILESAESCAAIGGIFIKLAWDEELSPYPIPVTVQSDKGIPEFKFGILTAATFWKDILSDGSKYYRLIERYERGYIKYTLYLGSSDKLGKVIPLDSLPETSDYVDVIETGVNDILCVYVPNMLPNRLERGSYLGRSDYSGIEGLMDSLDETYSSWIRDIALAQAKVLLPEGYFEQVDAGDGTLTKRYNIDKMLYQTLNIDPTIEGSKITPVQFAIRADEFEKSSLNLLERVITSAGYSPQSFGLNIQGRAESGTALSIRERKSFATKNKKQSYWQPAISKIVHLMMQVYNEQLKGKMELDVNVNVAFSDGITNDINEMSQAVKTIADAMGASTKTKVKLLHPDWNEEQVNAEVKLIIDENGLGNMVNPDMVGIDNPLGGGKGGNFNRN